MSAAAIHLGGKLAAIRKLNHGGRAKGRPAIQIGPRMPGTFLECLWPALYRQDKMQSKKCPLGISFVLVKVGIAPLTGNDEIQAAIAIHISNGNAPAIHRSGKPG